MISALELVQMGSLRFPLPSVAGWRGLLPTYPSVRHFQIWVAEFHLQYGLGPGLPTYLPRIAQIPTLPYPPAVPNPGTM